MPVVTIADYNTYRNPRHPFTRQCPNFRTCWPGLSASYNPLVSSRPLMLRRISFLLIQLLQLTHIALHTTLQSLSTLSQLPWTATTLLFFFFVAWNLHLIVQMEGERIVFGKRFSKVWFDAFLWGLVVAYAGLVVGDWMAGDVWRYEAQVAEVLLDLVIFLVAWVSTWAPYGTVVFWGEEQV